MITDDRFISCFERPLVTDGLLPTLSLIPREVAEKCNPGVLQRFRRCSGGRIRFRTDSGYIKLKILYENGYTGYERGNSHFSLFTRDGNECVPKGIFAVEQDADGAHFTGQLKTDGIMHDYIIYFPIGDRFDAVYLGFESGKTLEEGRSYTYTTPIVFYGSSIVHGNNSSDASCTYPARIARKLDSDFVNLGFSGSARAEPDMIKYIATLDMTAFVYDYDHNAPSVEFLKETHYEGYRLFRSLRPDVPVIFGSKPDYFNGNPENDIRRNIIIEDYNRGLESGDKNLYFVDGKYIFPEDVKNDCSADGCHPNDEGYMYMAKAFIEPIKKILAKQ